MSNTPNLKLPYIDANQNQKSVTHNAALTVLDALVNLQVQSNALAAPPSSPGDGQCWIVAAGGSGAWAGKDLNIAAWQDGVWNFYPPNRGFIAYVDNIGGALMWSGSAWVSLLGVVSQLSLNALGIGTAVDTGNPLSAKLNSALFAALPTSSSGTGDVRLKLSKQATGNTATVLFQDNFSGRAEIGLAGDDNFHVKVSADGSTWYDAMDIAAATGTVSFLNAPAFPSAAAGDSSTKGATTAFVGAAVAAVTARTQVNDAAYAVLATDRTVAVIALSTARIITLPAASTYPAGATLTIVDESGACSATNTISIARTGSDTINGATSAVLSTPYAYLALESNGFNKWTVIDQPSGMVSALNGGPLAGFRNRIINGNFAINQRVQASGTALAATAYGHDRWKAGASGCTYTFTVAAPDTTITITAGTLTQIIEAANIEGGTYVLSWTGTATARVYQGTATGSYVESPLIVTRLAGGTNTTVEFSTGTLGKVQFEPGSIATVFERRAPLELQLCQRYYATFTAVLLAGYAAAGGPIYYDIFLPVTMLATPSAGYANIVYSNMSGLALNVAQTAHVRSYATMTATGQGYAQYDIALTAEL